MRFESLEQAESFKKENRDYLEGLEKDCLALPGVYYAEAWLCGNTESFIACFNKDDEIIKEVLIKEPGKAKKERELLKNGIIVDGIQYAILSSSKCLQVLDINGTIIGTAENDECCEAVYGEYRSQDGATVESFIQGDLYNQGRESIAAWIAATHPANN